MKSLSADDSAVSCPYRNVKNGNTDDRKNSINDGCRYGGDFRCKCSLERTSCKHQFTDGPEKVHDNIGNAIDCCADDGKYIFLTGIFGKLFECQKDKAHKLSLIHILKKYNFQYCGIVYMADGGERLAFEKAVCIA